MTETATLRAAFSPNRLGASTTISFGFRIGTTEGAAADEHDAADACRPELPDHESRPVDLPAGDTAREGARRPRASATAAPSLKCLSASVLAPSCPNCACRRGLRRRLSENARSTAL